MDQFQNNQIHAPKRHFLQLMVQRVLGNSGGRSIHETISGINAALGAFKNYAKEWDKLHGILPEKSVATRQQIPKVNQQQSMPLPQAPQRMPLVDQQQSMPLPQTPKRMPADQEPTSFGVGWGP